MRTRVEPQYKSRTDILYLLEKHQVLIVTGETGSGKSTQIPQYLMEAGWAQKGQMIGITQPRRVAAISSLRSTIYSSFSKSISAEILSIQGRVYPVEVYYLNDPVANYVKASVETMKVFEPFSPKVRKVVVATNIAEASVTINGIVYVVDSGFVKLNFFNPKTSTDALVVVPASQSSAEQRAGRAGRVSSGKVYRLYREEDFKCLPMHTVPEIQRSNLATFILQLKSLGVDNIAHFSFPAAPPSNIVINALELDYALGALDSSGNLTELGMKMVTFPVSTMQAKMLLASGEFGCSQEALTIVAMLQIESIFLQPSHRRAEARKAKYKFSVLEGDLLTLLNVYNAFIQKGKDKQWCGQMYLNYKGLMRATEIRKQLHKLLQKCKVPIVSCEGDTDAVCRCIVTGYFANAAYLHYSGEYRTVCGDHTLAIHPTSVLYTQKQPKWTQMLQEELCYECDNPLHDWTS
ncbi:hypothetical protein HPB47_006050 [Ixodes persulcatus]|uniref:Uncharacterized protein n=1 Tax=Ixodes persulcatus TaxID=34615 RepID=A0AC60PC86_IXOPE|nr:hypothetical protein HPB47_006050 [Ixodes persulcatus]